MNVLLFAGLTLILIGIYLYFLQNNIGKSQVPWNFSLTNFATNLGNENELLIKERKELNLQIDFKEKVFQSDTFKIELRLEDGQDTNAKTKIQVQLDSTLRFLISSTDDFSIDQPSYDITVKEMETGEKVAWLISPKASGSKKIRVTSYVKDPGAEFQPCDQLILDIKVKPDTILSPRTRSFFIILGGIITTIIAIADLILNILDFGS